MTCPSEHLCGIASLVIPHGPPAYLTAHIASSAPRPPATHCRLLEWNCHVTGQRITSAVTACFRCMKWASTCVVDKDLRKEVPTRPSWSAQCGDLLKRCDWLLQELRDGFQGLDAPQSYCAARRRCISSASHAIKNYKRKDSSLLMHREATQEVGDVSKRPRILESCEEKSQLIASTPDLSLVLSYLRNKFVGVSIRGESVFGNSSDTTAIRVVFPHRGDALTVLFNDQTRIPVFATITSRQRWSHNICAASVGAGATIESICEAMSAELNKRLWSQNDTARSNGVLGSWEDVIEHYILLSASGVRL